MNQAEWEGKVCWAGRTAVQRPRGRRELGGSWAEVSQWLEEGEGGWMSHGTHVCTCACALL